MFAAIFYAISIIGAAVGAYASIQSSRDQRHAAEYQKRMAEYNARLAEQRAAAEEMHAHRETTEGIERQREARRRGEQMISIQRSLLAKGGVDLDFGSPLALLADTAAETELDARRTAYESRLAVQARQQRAIDSRTEGILYGMEAGAASARGSAAQRAGYWQAGTSLLGGAASIRRMQ